MLDHATELVLRRRRLRAPTLRLLRFLGAALRGNYFNFVYYDWHLNPLFVEEVALQDLQDFFRIDM